MNATTPIRDIWTPLVYLLANAAGLLAILLPFLAPTLAPSQAQVSPLFLPVMVSFCFLALLLEAQTGATTAKTMALLGVLVAINAVLRFIEVAIPGPGGFSPVFFLIIVAGYVFGARFGFLMGALTLLVSAITTGGIGPWLPGQMLTASWVGLSAGALGQLTHRRGLGERAETVILTVAGIVWGFVYGVIVNLWFWPYTVGTAMAGIESAWDLLARYAAYYVATSALWDLSRALGNAILLGAFGRPALRALRRFHRRFTFTYRPNSQ
ncbi:MAG: ECF transporter S component [Anaerolineae bacterium]|nr:ECF transporter S component [Anaerolineae bacterium]